MISTYIPPGEGQHHQMIDGDHIAKTAVDADDGRFEVFEVHATAGPTTPPHVSPWTSVLYLLDGRLTASVDEQEHQVEPGGLVTFPAGRACTFTVEGDSARFLAITTGARAGRFFADFASSVPADQPVDEALPQILSVTSRHGVAMG